MVQYGCVKPALFRGRQVQHDSLCQDCATFRNGGRASSHAKPWIVVGQEGRAGRAGALLACGCPSKVHSCIGADASSSEVGAPSNLPIPRIAEAIVVLFPSLTQRRCPLLPQRKASCQGRSPPRVMLGGALFLMKFFLMWPKPAILLVECSLRAFLMWSFRTSLLMERLRWGRGRPTMVQTPG